MTKLIIWLTITLKVNQGEEKLPSQRMWLLENGGDDEAKDDSVGK
jgi:hypothetical protein